MGVTDSFSPYAEVHQNTKGTGDARPTALQICKDNGRLGTMTDKTVLVTGATSGIGVETARALHHTGADVYFTARDLDKAQGVLQDIKSTSPGTGKLEVIEMELESLDSVRKAAAQFLKQSGRLNIMINNVAIMACPEGKTTDGFERQFGTNHLSHFLLFNLLKDTLLQSSTPTFQSRVVNVSSSGHRASSVHLDNLELKDVYTPWGSYGQSKTSNIWMANYIERVYGPKGIHGHSLNPGGIWTGLQKHVPELIEKYKDNAEVAARMKNTEQGAATSVWAAVGQVWEGTGGKYLEDCAVAGETQDSGAAMAGYKAYAYDPAGEDQLWTVSEKLVGLA